MENERIELAYYKESVEISIPKKNLIAVLQPKKIYKAEDLSDCINYNLDHPIGTLPFNEACAGKKKVCIVISDLSRPMEAEKVLPILLSRLNEYAPTAKISILIALGTHRALTDEEIDQLCGKGIREKYPVINHASNDKNHLTKIRCTCDGIPDVYVNSLLTESDFNVAVGAVKPHPIFGWSGGVKTVIPGVADYDTIGYSHWMSCPHRGVDIMGKVDNPVRSLYEKIVVNAGLMNFILNAVLTEKSEIADVRCGHIIEAHRACVEIACRYYIQEVDEPADAVLVGVGKWGADMWVGSNAIYQSEFFLKKGGTIVLFGNFPEGFSSVHTEIAQWGYKSYHEVKKLVDNGILSNDLTLAAHLVHVGRVLEAREAECVLVSRGISCEQAQRANLGYLDSPDKAVKYIKEKYGDKARILVIPGYNSTPIISSYPQQ